MTMIYTNTLDEAERLAFAAEEMGEAIHMIGKTLRHGFDSSHADYNNVSNRELIAHEIGHVLAAIDLLIASDIKSTTVQLSRERKHETVKQYFHWQ